MDKQPDIVRLSDREQLILQAVVHTYITTAEAVGSRSIVKRFGLSLSPATVRNVMADLEEAGFLQQLHTSSGRVPTDRGYRYYVDYLMRVQELTLAERTRIERELSQKLNDADEVMRQTSHLLALISHQTGLVEAPSDNNAEVRRIELIPITASRIAVLIVDNYGRVRTQMVTLGEPLSSEALPRLNRFLNEELDGVAFDQMIASIQAKTRALFDEQQRLAESAVRVLSLVPAHRPSQLFLEGVTQLLEQPEFRDVDKAQEVFSLLDERDLLVDLLRRRMTEAKPFGASVVIGAEAREKGLAEISVVASPYRVGEKKVGMLGILGPRRMPYSRLTAVVDYTAGLLSRLLTQLSR